MNYWRTTANTLQELVACLSIKSARVKRAMLAIDRKIYCPKEHEEEAYEDHPLSIGYGQTISAPHMHAFALDLLNEHLVPGNKALDIGSGSGYLLGCMAHMMEDQNVPQHSGKVYGVEYEKTVFEQSMDNLNRDTVAKQWLNKTIFMKCGDGWHGWAEHGPYNAIHVGAAATKVPRELLAQLARGGRLVIPVGQRFAQDLMVIDKDQGGRISERVKLEVMYVPLVNPSNAK